MYKLLIVEDEIVLSDMYKFEFIHRNFEVLTAHDGVQALNIIREKKPDFVMLDIMLPVIDGINVFRDVLKDPKTQNIPVGFVSALGREIAEFVGQDREILEKAAFFIQKDQYTPRQIADEIEKFLKSHNASKSQ